MTLPKGCVPLFELERNMQRIVLADKNLAKLKPFGKRPKWHWESQTSAEKLAELEPRLRLIYDTPDLFSIARGVAIHLLEMLVFNDENENGVFLYHNNSLIPASRGSGLYSPMRLLLVEDAAVAPKACVSNKDVLGFVEFGNNRRNNQVFLEPGKWIVRDHPRFDLCPDSDSREYCNQIWNQLHSFGGAVFVFQYPAKSLGSGWVTKSKFDWEASHKLKKLLNPLPTPKRDSEKFNRLVQQASAHYLSLREPEKLKFGKPMLAEFLGYPGMPPENSGLRAIMNAVLKSLPVEDRERLKVAGRKPA